jgi:ferredoxin
MKISFEDENFVPVEVPPGTCLGDVLDGPHSPVFFGCKSGNCGTCLVEVDADGVTVLPPPDELERELLETLAPDNPRARLACQLSPETPLRLRYLTH